MVLFQTSFKLQDTFCNLLAKGRSSFRWICYSYLYNDIMPMYYVRIITLSLLVSNFNSLILFMWVACWIKLTKLILYRFSLLSNRTTPSAVLIPKPEDHSHLCFCTVAMVSMGTFLLFQLKCNFYVTQRMQWFKTFYVNLFALHNNTLPRNYVGKWSRFSNNVLCKKKVLPVPHCSIFYVVLIIDVYSW